MRVVGFGIAVWGSGFRFWALGFLFCGLQVSAWNMRHMFWIWSAVVRGPEGVRATLTRNCIRSGCMFELSGSKRVTQRQSRVL